MASKVLLPALLISLLLTSCAGDSPDVLVASAKDYLAKNDSKAAVIQIKNALQINPDLAEARFLLGKALLNEGDGASSEVELRKASALKHPVEQVLPLLARAMVLQGKQKKLIDEFGNVNVGAAIADAEIKTLIAEAHASLGSIASAERSLEEALAVKPDHPPALIFQARLKGQKGDMAGALSLVDAVIAKDGKNAEAIKLRGDLAFAQRDVVRAESYYREAIAAKQDLLLAHVALVSVLIGQNKLDDAAKQVDVFRKVAAKSPVVVFFDARIAFLKKDIPKARELAQQFLKMIPDSALGLQLAGSIEYQAQVFTQAEQHFSKLVRLSPDSIGARRQLAMTYLRLGQPVRAQSTIDPVLGKFDQQSDMLALAGEVAMQNGDVVKAERYYAKASALDPNDIPKRTALALAHLAQGNTSAFMELEQIAAVDPGIRADMALVATSIRKGQFDAALKAIDRLEKKQAKSPVPSHLRAGVYLGMKDIPRARRSLGRALELNAAYFPSAAALASLDYQDNKPNDAKRRFETVLASDPKNMQAMIALAELKEKTGGALDDVVALLAKAISANPEEIAPRLAMIEFYRRNNDLKKALSAAQDAVATTPDRIELQEIMGRIQLASGEPNQALTTFGKIAAIKPDSPIPHLLVAEAQLAIKNRDAAAQSFRKALEIKPDLLEAQRGLVGLHLSSGSADQALAVSRQVQKQRPKEAFGFFFEGDVRSATKSWADAALAYRKGLKLAASSEYAIKLHGVLGLSGKTSEADQFATGWIKEQPQDFVFRLYLGDRALTSKNPAAAAAHYRVVAEARPNNALALNNLAYALFKAKDQRSLGFAEKANKLAPNNPAFIDTLAVILLDRGDTARALDLQRKAVTLAPQSHEIRVNLIRALARSGDKAAARKEFDSLVKLGDKGPRKDLLDTLAKEL